MQDWDSLKPLERHSRIMIIIILGLLAILIFTPRHAFQISNDFSNSDTTGHASANQIGGSCIIKVQKAYFHNQPNENSMNKHYLEESQKVEYLKEENGYLYVVYTNEARHITKGWINKDDVEIISDN